MMFRMSILSAVFAAATATPMGDISANSPLGSKLLSKARRLDDGDVDYTWVAGYSVKFQGCHHSLSWNADADGEEDAKIYNQRLVRFRLCPSDSCSGGSSASGCDASTAGEYVVDLAQFADAYTEAKMTAQEYECETAREDCENGECANANDDDVCEASCLQGQGLYDQCWEGDDDEAEFDIQEYLECAEFNGNNRRRLNDEVAYYVGPYCSDDGSQVHLGLFMDDTCTVAADSGTYETLTYGSTLPYSSSTGNSIVEMDCVSCKEPVDEDDQNDGDQEDADEVIEMCENLYAASSKCETYLSGVVTYPSEDACNYIEGIQITRADGTVTVEQAPSKAAGAFIGIFAVTTILLGAYVYYLKSKLDRSRINLGSE